MSGEQPTDSTLVSPDDLLAAFREHYHRFTQAVNDTISNATDSIVLARLGDALDEYSGLVNEVCLVSLPLNWHLVIILISH
jgi:hypothetical protein